ncbi:AhpA/YtjB family protein [Shewanella xiamenensis]|uniref:AhpA/YtjB family protein n=1 Tax=Shewanella xiamenensis TaxID=332186 RepID=A0ABT6U6K5_9GAMM|nr:AhpA/YtjB family protein [Shewanella xiamenensis]MDI5829966.1 AhpA/YtjB family protein [Shewanella xiamenensis]
MIRQALSLLRVKVLYLKGLKKSHKISRLLQIAIALTLMVGLVQLWQTSLLQGQLLLKSQTQKMARLLVQQTAYSAAPALQLQNDEQLQWLASALVEDPKVMSAAIFSDQGIRLAFAQSLTKDALDPESEEMSLLLSKYPPYVEPVTQDGKNLGYVEVRLDTKLFFNEIKEAHNLNMEQQQIMLLVAGLIGMLLSRALSFKRADFDRRRTRAKLRKNPKKNKAIKTPEAAEESKPAGHQDEQLDEVIASDTEAAQKPTENKETEENKQTTDTLPLGKITENAKVPDENSNQASIQPKVKKAKAITETKTESEQMPEQVSDLKTELKPETAPEIGAKDDSSSNTMHQSKTQSTQTVASATEPQTSVFTPKKPKVKSVRRVKTNTSKSSAEKVPVQPSDLDTDSTG